MKRLLALRTSVITLTILIVLASSAPLYSQGPTPPGITELQQDTGGDVNVTWNPVNGTPSFVRGQIPVSKLGLAATPDSSAIAYAVVNRYAKVFGVAQSSQELRLDKTDVDALGMTHLMLHQVYQGVEVYDSLIKVHLSADQHTVTAISSAFIPNIHLTSVQPLLSVEVALSIAGKAMPKGTLVGQPKLVIYTGATRALGESARLAWLVELRDDALPAHNVYVLDAIAGGILDVLERLYDQTQFAVPSSIPAVRTSQSAPSSSVCNSQSHNGLQNCGDSPPLAGAITPYQGDTHVAVPGPLPSNAASLNRLVFTAANTYTLPGTLVRTEGQVPTDDQDADNAYAFAGDTFNYYLNTHGRNSYDDNGAPITSTVHYGTNYQQAFWNGQQMVYGDGFVVNDVVGHELTHAVTERTAQLEYRWQSGALNESISDVFGAMIDRDDWLIGEDLPAAVLAGRDAVRDMSNPSRLGQPDNTQNWVQTCTDNEGVHSNSGITNKAYYNIATAIGKDLAERIFYRVLTVYLQPTSGLEDARAASLQATWDLSNTLSYTASYSDVVASLTDGFNAVGIDGSWNPPANSCTCAATTALADTTIYPNPMTALAVATALYRARDQLLDSTPVGQHYRTLYEQQTGRISLLLLQDPKLRTMGGTILQEVAPELNALMDGNGAGQIVTNGIVSEVRSFLLQLAEQDRSNGGGALARIIEQEMSLTDWDRLVGMSFDEAWAYLNTHVTVKPNILYLPTILK
jgi:bacillolysin